MNKSEQFLSDDEDGFLSLSKLIGKEIKDVIGNASDPFGGTPLFQIFSIVFADGTQIFVEGEHDVPYLPADERLKNMDEETLQALIDEDAEEENA